MENIIKGKGILDNEYKEEVGKALIEAEYVQLRRGTGRQRIMPVKKRKM
ncbi:MAG: hypothetical protein ACTTJE_09500 [Schwartzia sp. (in: firmicutes)]